jgi:hypothetical protein
MFVQDASGSAAITLSDVDQSFFVKAVAVIALSMLALMGVALAYSTRRRRSVERRGQMPERDLLHLREELIEAVWDASTTQGAFIRIRKFQKERGLTTAQHYVVLKELLERQVLYPAYSADGLVAFFQHVRWDFLHLPVTAVRLSEQHWQQMTKGQPAGIAANGDVIFVQDSPGAGVVSRSTNVTQTFTQEVSPALVDAVARALRNDAGVFAPGHTVREQAESYADTLERDAAAGRWTSVRRTLGEVLAFTNNGMGLWAATLAILAAS